MEDLLLKSLINSYWYYVAMYPKVGSALEQTNLAHLIQKVRNRIEKVQ